MSEVSAIIDTIYVLVINDFTFPAYIVSKWLRTLFKYQTMNELLPHPRETTHNV